MSTFLSALAASTLNLHLDAAARLLVVSLDHGHANEMGSGQLADWDRLAQALEAGHPDAPRTMITTSTRKSRRGTPLFISGADVTERTGWDDARVKAHVRHQRAVLQRLRRAPVFHIAVVDGVALGWGTEFLLCCDYRIATSQGSFALPETGIGILPGAGGTSELWSVVGVNQALRLGMTGERIDATEATRIGLVDEAVDDHDAGMARARALATLVARRSPTAVAAFKRGVLASVGSDRAARTETEARAYEHCVDSGDAAIGRAGFRAIIKGEEVEWSRLDPYTP